MEQRAAKSIQELFELRQKCSGSVPPSAAVAPFIDTTLGILFPQLALMPAPTPEILESLVDHAGEILLELAAPVLARPEAENRVEEFVDFLPMLHSLLIEDARAIAAGDPAATSIDEVIVAYPGFFAIAVYRLASWLLRSGVPTVPRMLTEHAHRVTGIDIHPGATIGPSFFIDHGTGIVIGETTVIKEHVKLYQGVTLGALSVDKTMADEKRHPTIERNVVIYANATILGGGTIVGEGSIIGGNVWLTSSVPANSRVYHRSEISVKAP